jgi:hypothetical protein
VITLPDLPDGTVGKFYHFTIIPQPPDIYNFTLISGSLPPGLNLVTALGELFGTPTTPGAYTFTLRTRGFGQCPGFRTYTMAIHAASSNISAPEVCNSATVTVSLTNNAASAQNATFTSTLSPQLLAIQGACSANVGECAVVNASTLTWSGVLAAGQTATIVYQAQIAAGVMNGAQVCATTTATIGSSSPTDLTACATVNCPAIGPGALPPTTSPPSDQKAGSVLIYNLYTSSTDPNRQNTRINITNIEPTRAAFVHMFFVDGATCGVADSSICLTSNQTASFLVSDLDPGTNGYIVAVAVDKQGCPINFNYLIGDEYVKFTSGHAANLGAEAITAIAAESPSCDRNSTTAVLAFDGVSYSALPHALALDNLGSRLDGNETLLILNRLGGDLATGAATLTSIFGLVFDDAENGLSFSFAPGACQFRSNLANSFPRTAPRFENLIPTGRSGWMKLWAADGTAAMTGAAINFNANTAASATAFNQGHNLHVLTLTTAASFAIPIFPPAC